MLESIITDILKAEGWDAYTNRPTDRGGPTKWGITLQAWRGYCKNWDSIDERDIQTITEADARKFYWSEHIKTPRFDQLPLPLMPMVVDCGVHHGTQVAATWVQQAVGVRRDGIIGPKTLYAVNSANVLAVYQRVLASRFRLYGRLVTTDPIQAEYAHGWNNRGAKWLDYLAEYLSEG